MVGRKRQWLPPHAPDDSAFWKQYDKAEAMNGEVRAAVTEFRKAQGGHLSRYEDPLRECVRDPAGDSSGRDHERTDAALLLAQAIDTVLERHGLLGAITNGHSDDSAVTGQQLLIAA